MSHPLDRLRGSHCLVTGGAGFIGSHLVDGLRAAGATVRVLDNFSTGFKHNLVHTESDDGVDVIDGDASNRDDVAAAVEGIDYIFHHAAMASVPRSIREPALCHAWCATSTVELLHAAASGGVKRLVLASTSAAYGDSPFVSKRESDPVAPLSPYAAAKLAAEAYCNAFHQSFEIETVVLRYFNVFGPRQDPQSEYSAVIPRFVAKILSNEKPIIFGDGEQSRDFVFVGDVAKANMLAATTDAAAGGTFNIGRGERTSLLTLLNLLRGILGQGIDPVHEPARIGDVRDSLADINVARSRLGFDPEVSIEEGLRKSIDYYRDLFR
ncbi:NAD-dependent epimerase/dehydratase family protein [Novipirellula artificiosorum]|uniref:UDP-glucose 4-epimerase n=1 Tax=Novipirellula artificiosorum TaxID=2528016 RepID=A0A5C6DEL9_9BACT|nr:NAD-dependent epimerase/dehydratase family protein [Novipirellula artificiosorum]TWU35172.1 UDP-glucose 4-epimerase [Novipirellula artificiosorum]